MADNKQLMLSRADSAVIARDFSLAARLYKTLLNDDSQNVELLMKLGDVYQKSGQNESALNVYKQIPNDANAACEMGAIYRRLKQYEESIAILEQALVFGGQKAKIYYNLGFTYRESKQYDSAIRCFEEVLNENPNDVLVFNHIGAIHAEKGDHEKAVAAYLRGLKIDQNHPILNLNIAKSYEKLGQKKSAMASYENTLRAKPGMLEAVEGYSSLLIRENKIKEAYEVINNAVHLNPNNVDMHIKLGNVYERMDNYEKAEMQYEEALEQKEGCLPALFGLADTQEKQEKFEDAVRTMRKAEQIEPDNEQMLKKSAHVLLSANYLPAAFDKLNTLMAKDDRDLETLNLMGQYYICTGEENNRDAIYQKISSIDPLYYDHFKEGGKRYKDLKDYDNSVLFLNKVLAKNPQDLAALVVLGRVYEQQGNFKDALAMYSKANTLDNSSLNVKNAIYRLKQNDVPIESDEILQDEQEVNENPIEEQIIEETAEDQIAQDEGQEQKVAEEQIEENIEQKDEEDAFDFEKFGMDKLIEDEAEDDINSLVFDDDNSLDEKPTDTEEVKKLDDLLDDDVPFEADEVGDIVKIPDGSMNDFEDEMPFEDEDKLNNSDVFEEMSEPIMTDDGAEEEIVEDKKVEEPKQEIKEELPPPPPPPLPQPIPEPSLPPSEPIAQPQIDEKKIEQIEKIAQMAENALEKANYAAEKAWLAAEKAADAAQSAEVQLPEDEFIEDAKLGLDALDGVIEEEQEEVESDPQQILLERAVKMLPSIVRVISDKEMVDKFKSTLEMFKKLRELLEYLPDVKKQEFLQSETRLLLDYVISRLSGRPGLYETARALRDGGLVKGDEEFIEEKDGIELVKKVLSEISLLISYIDDGNMRAILMQAADSLYEKL